MEFINELLSLYKNESYEACIEMIEASFVLHPQYANNNLIKNIYISCCLKNGYRYKENGQMELARQAFDKVLQYEGELLIDSDMILYHLYGLFAEVYDTEDSLTYIQKAKEIVDKITASNIMQKIYLSFVQGKYDEVLQKMKHINIDTLDLYNRGRYYMIIGHTYYYMGKYGKALENLELSLSYYQQIPYKSMQEFILDTIHKCNINLGKDISVFRS